MSTKGIPMFWQDIYKPAPWTKDAVCATVDRDLWFSPEVDPAALREAKRLCGECPARNPCLQHALEQDERWGVWGGLTTGERARMRKANA